MGYAKERGKLEKLLLKISDLTISDHKNLLVLHESHDDYSHVIRILKNKNPDTFGDLYRNELQEIKEFRKSIKQIDLADDLDKHFNIYKNSIINALEKTIKVTNETS
ncbi:MAG: hypothetical protein ACOH2A_03600 [Sphingobacteriaceae bacterium]